MTLNQSVGNQSFYGVTSEPAGYANSVSFIGSGATPGLLQPGESETVPVHYAGWLWPLNFSYPPEYFSVRHPYGG